MIKEFTKASVALIEAHKAPVDIKIGDHVFRDWEYQYIDRFGMLKLLNARGIDTARRYSVDIDSGIVVLDRPKINGVGNIFGDDIRIHPKASFEIRTSRKWINRERKNLGEAKRKIRAIAMDYNAPLMRQALEGMRAIPAVYYSCMSFKQRQE